LAKKKEEKKEEVEATSTPYNYESDLEELEPKSYVRAGFIYHIEHGNVEIKSKKDLEKVYNDYMKND